MKPTFKKKPIMLIWLILAMLAAFTIVGCSANGYDAAGTPSSGITDDFIDTGDESPDDTVENPDDAQQPSAKPIVKQLTAAEWRDALNHEFWLKLFDKNVEADGQQNGEQPTRNGIFYEYANATRGLDSFDMHEVRVTCDGNPVAGATVKLCNDADVVYSAVTDSAGIAYVFGDGTRADVASGEFEASASIADDGVTDINLADFAAVENELEIMLVVDTTGSMGDELSFLRDELAGVVTRVSAALDCNIRLGLLFYRDEGDEYVTRKFDFINVTSSLGLNIAVRNIKAQSSSGGGDYPEAVDTALSEAVAANWHDDSKTKLMFFVLDAPYHDKQANQSVFSDAVKSAAQKGIRIIPVAASGLDVLGQYIMRSAALLTGGTYTFLTDDSGIGNSHELPDVGDYTVEYLSDLMVRLIKGYYTGTFEAPVHWTQSDSVA